MPKKRDVRQEWETPNDFFDVVDAEFRFQLDAAATAKNYKCVRYIDPINNALDCAIPWVCDRVYHVWLNPGFSGVNPWMEKAYTEAQKRPEAVVVVMARISPSTKWWRDWAMKAFEIRLLTSSHPNTKRFKSRLQFKPPRGIKASSNAQENCLIIFRPNLHNLPPHIRTWDWTIGLPKRT